jgi:predicted nucleic acid-binding protein
MIVLDTNVLSELMQKEPPTLIVGWMARFQYDDFYTTSISVAEITAGIAYLPAGRRRSGLELAASNMFEKHFATRVLPFDGAAALLYAEVMAHRRHIGRPLKSLDAMIAAIARSRGVAVATRNVSDFEECGITLHDPWRD